MSTNLKHRTMSSKPGAIAGNALVHLLLAVLSAIWLAPLAWIVMTSLRNDTGSYFKDFFPKNGLTLRNYTELFDPANRQLLDFPRMFMNTLFISIFACIIGTTFVVFVAYIMSRRRYKTRRFMMNVNMILGLFPGFMAMIAVYFILKAMGLTQGNWIYLALILVYSAGSGSGFLLLKGYMDTIPKSLDEAATIDGCTQWEVFSKVILPISKPMIVYQILMSFLGPWLDFIFAKVIAGANSKYYTVSVGLWSMLDKERTYDWYLNFAAGAVLVSLPIGILTILMQRFYNQSMSGAVKG
ncbi:MAG: ABC transporter permease subunit [Clostridia bacterium]|nr:ABC transporter permease subunit [Clostridia bacterium]